MHAMFLHPAFPGPFAAVAHHAATLLGWQCTYVTHVDTRHLTLPFMHINYRLKEDVPSPAVFTNPPDLPALLEHMAAIYRGLRAAPQVRPDLVVGHVSYGTMLYLRNLYHCPFVGYFELYPGHFWDDGLVLRKEFPPSELTRLVNSTYHALSLLHLHAVDAAYTPSRTQMAMCPVELRHKLRVLPDGVDCQAFQPRPRPARLGDLSIGPDTRVVTYVSRGLESVRGFDIFMRVAKRIAERRPDVLFVVAGAERTNHGHELAHIGKQSFKEWVLAQDSYDLSRFAFVGWPPLEQLTALYNLSDLHIHLSVPYVPSPSLSQAMASGCAILGSATPPVQEYVTDGATGRLAPFDDVEALSQAALELLDNPEQAKSLGAAARQHVLERYEIGACVRRVAEFLKGFAARAVDQAFGA